MSLIVHPQTNHMFSSGILLTLPRFAADALLHALDLIGQPKEKLDWLFETRLADPVIPPGSTANLGSSLMAAGSINERGTGSPAKLSAVPFQFPQGQAGLGFKGIPAEFHHALVLGGCHKDQTRRCDRIAPVRDLDLKGTIARRTGSCHFPTTPC